MDFKCGHCKQIFSQKIELEEHILSKHKEMKDLWCAICNKKYHSKQYLMQHVNEVHEKSVKFECVCGKVFYRKSLKIHNAFRGETSDIT